MFVKFCAEITLTRGQTRNTMHGLSVGRCSGALNPDRDSGWETPCLPARIGFDPESKLKPYLRTSGLRAKVK